MQARSTWFWLSVASALLVVALLQHHLRRPPPAPPTKVLSDLHPAEVSVVQVRYKDQPDPIRVERTNSVWRLTKPVDYPALGSSVEGLLAALERLAPALYLSPHQRLAQPHASEEQGLTQPQCAIFLQQGDRAIQLDLGAFTPPGDQIFAQATGDTGVYILALEFLKFLPKNKDDWRDRGLLDLKGLVFDRVAVTNAARVLELQRAPGRNQWKIVNPDIGARANAERLERLLLDLEASRVAQFVADGPGVNLDAFGLHPPSLEIALANGTNLVALLQFGASPTNDPTLIYARRAGKDTVVTLPTNNLAAWRDSVSAFRDPHLATLPPDLAAIEVRAEEKFTVQRQGTNGWRVLPQNLPADADAVADLLGVVSQSPIVDYKDAVLPSGLREFGLAPPYRKFILQTAASSTTTNAPFLELNFGATNDNKVFVNRTDETSPLRATVYSLKLADFQRLPTVGLQLRQRRPWRFTPDVVERATINQGGKEVQVIHSGPSPIAWSLPPGTPGRIDPLAVNETIRELGQLQITNWVAHGETNRSRYGLNPADRLITVQLKSGDRPALELGKPTTGVPLYGAVNQAGELWFFEVPAWLIQWVDQNLALPP